MQRKCPPTTQIKYYLKHLKQKKCLPNLEKVNYKPKVPFF